MIAPILSGEIGQRAKWAGQRCCVTVLIGLTSIGLLISCIYLLPSSDKKYFQFASLLSIFVIVYFSMISYWQISYWKNRNILFSRVLEVIGPNYKAHIHLAQDYTDRGMLKEARRHSLAALDIQPAWPDAYLAMGNITLAERKFQEAEKFYRLALSKGQKSASLVNNIGITMAEQGISKVVPVDLRQLA